LIAVADAAMIRSVRWASALLCGGALVACDLLPGQAAEPDASPHSGGDAATPGSHKAGAGDDAGADDDSNADGGEHEAQGDDTARVAWQLQLETVPRTVAVTDRGTVFALAESGIEGYVDGKSAWKKEGSFGGITRLVDGGVVTTTGATIVAFDPSTGEERFRVDIPAPEGWPTKTRKGDPIPPPAIVAAASFGSQLLVADQEARFFEIDPPTCTKGEPACLRPAGVLDGEVLEVGTRLTVADDGTRYLIEEDTLRVFDQLLATSFELESPGRIAAVVPIGASGLAIAANGQVSLLQMPRCRGASLRIPAVPMGSKQCFRWRYGIDLDDAAPAVIDEHTLAINGSRSMQALTEGTDAWKSPIGSVGPVLAGGDGLLYTIAVEQVDGKSTAAVKAVHPLQGTVEWSVQLPFDAIAPAAKEGEVAAEIVVPETLSIDTRGTWLVAALDQNVALVAIPSAPAEGS
jgi:outer membrane protein assembly factor BamB